MYSKTRNTLTALIAASLLVASGWLVGRPVAATVGSDRQSALPAQVSIAGAGAPIAMVSSSLHARHANRMSLGMPYYSFSLSMSQRRAD
jgi:hypothetical protein